MPDPAPSEEAAVPPENVPSEQAPVVEVPEPKEIDDPAVSDLVTVEEVDVPEAAARALTSTEDSIIEQVDLKPFHMAAVSWNQDIEATGVEILMSIRVGGAWTTWQALSVADGEGSPSASDPLWTSEAADGVRARVTSDQGPLADLKITTVDPGDAGAVDSPAVYARDQSGVVESTAVSRPAIISRAGWGAGPGTGCRTAPLAMRSVIIHHTAGANSYSRTESAGIVRSYQTMHIRTNGWCDIGYNFLVDKYGQIFEGRAGSINGHVAGAHAGHVSMSTNMNRVSTGIAMMGNFESANIWNAEWTTLRNTVAQLTAWRLQSFGLKPLTRVSYNGRTHFTVSGHRDWMATACPGRYGLDWLNAGNGLRAQVDRLMFPTPPQAPARPAAPTDVRATAVSSNAATVSWEPVSGASRYIVKYWRGNEPQQRLTVAGTSASLPVLAPAAPYQVSIAADVKGQVSFFSAVHALRTPEGRPAVPRAISATGVTSNAVTVRWQATPGAVSYVVKYWTESGKEQRRTVRIPQVSIEDLAPGSSYRVIVAAVGGGYTSYFSSPVALNTLEGRLATPANIRVSDVSETAIKVSWTAVAGASGYVVKYRHGNGAEERRTATGTSLTLQGLKSDAEYEIVVAATGKAHASYFSPVTRARTADGRPPTPTNVRVLAATDRGFTVSWDKVASATGYVVKYRHGDGTEQRRTLTATSVAISGLQARGHYHVVVAATANGKTSYFSPAVSVRTAARASAPRNITTSNSTNSSFGVSWSPQSDAVKYIVRYKDLHSGERQVETTASNVVIRGLAQGGTYTVSVAGVDQSGQRSFFSEPKRGTTTGRPATPSDVRVSPASDTSLRIAWSAVSGADHYVVKYRTDSSVEERRTTRSNSLTLTGLTGDSHYTVFVAAVGSTSSYFANASARTTGGATNATNVGYVRNGSLTVKGRGYGHGIGMSQYGAKGGAESGRSYAQILAHYYGGTTLSTRSSHVRVHVTAATSPEVTVMAVPGLRIQTVSGWDAALPTSVSGRSVSQWRIARGADTTTSRVQYRSGNSWYDYGSPWRGDGQFGVPNGTVTLVLPNGRQVAYRGVMKSVVPPGNPSARVTVNELFSLDDYIRGVVPREMPASWHPEAVKAQAVAARTYGLRSLRPSHYFDICDTTSCQVYGGASAEQAGSNRAIDATSNQVLLYRGAPAFTQFSSSSGGFTNQTANIAAHPYLRAVNDPWDGMANNPNHTWTQEVPASRIQSAYPQIGTLEKVRITRRSGNGAMGGRAWDIHLDGSRGSVQITGNAARSVFGLKSDWFGF
ncbi:SpoIID/LytB domain-containing protein [uncultured Aeromicrobium sp.]|uniref:SpoIID/LytB domain-containing protein n=1 Tax=uncultured Aeromicrobium sp. TaxID=337820 RepID=UPI0025E36E1A|nr:SpoIID/LytB domain-containing protein [uncultured Aeromicrobium sp.]